MFKQIIVTSILELIIKQVLLFILYKINYYHFWKCILTFATQFFRCLENPAMVNFISSHHSQTNFDLVLSISEFSFNIFWTCDVSVKSYMRYINT
jgi:hypothetical protein